MLTHEACEKILKQFPWLKCHEADLSCVLREEASYWMAQVEAQGGTADWASAVDKACDLITQWLERGTEFKFDPYSLHEVAKFIAIRRSACTWAVMMCKINAMEVSQNPPEI